MPFINTKVRYTVKPERKVRSHLTQDNKATRQSIYQTSVWRDLRKGVLVRDSGLCQCCLHRYMKRFTPANHVHHLKSFMLGRTEEGMRNLAFNIDNIVSVCSHCHTVYHAVLEQKGEDANHTIEQMAKIVDEYCHTTEKDSFV